MEKKKILLTGGGTAGHVTPNIALLPTLRGMGFEIHYVGSYDGIEKQLMSDCGIPYTGIATGKFRRYLSAKNFTDPFRVIKGYGEAKRLIRDYKPDVLFSKGGFVAVPVVLAAKKYHVPTIIHESDMTPGLANKICIPSAQKVCHSFPETAEHLPKEKAVYSGSPVRKELTEGDPAAGRALCGFSTEKPVLLVMGGSLGAVHVNNAVREALPRLLNTFQICHLCGKGKTDPSYEGMDGYVQFEYISNELPDIFAMTDAVISRAGANAIFELLALKKPNLLIPLSAQASRGDQILNAKSFAASGYSKVLPEENITPEKLALEVEDLYRNRKKYTDAMAAAPGQNAIDIITGLIRDAAGLSI